MKIERNIQVFTAEVAISRSLPSGAKAASEKRDIKSFDKAFRYVFDRSIAIQDEFDEASAVEELNYHVKLPPIGVDLRYLEIHEGASIIDRSKAYVGKVSITPDERRDGVMIAKLPLAELVDESADDGSIVVFKNQALNRLVPSSPENFLGKFDFAGLVLNETPVLEAGKVPRCHYFGLIQIGMTGISTMDVEPLVETVGAYDMESFMPVFPKR